MEENQTPEPNPQSLPQADKPQPTEPKMNKPLNLYFIMNIILFILLIITVTSTFYFYTKYDEANQKINQLEMANKATPTPFQ